LSSMNLAKEIKLPEESVLTVKKLLCQRHPFLYYLSVRQKIFMRYLNWCAKRKKYCSAKAEDLPVCIKRHQSLLVRRLGDSSLRLQFNKIKNLEIAVPKIDGILIRPGEIFSFWKIIGLPTRRKGYVEGMQLSMGEVKEGIGGGLCQLSNLLYWMVLHTPLTITERHHHGFDPFPDNNRTLPFGSGATVFYNYIDLQFKNETPYTFQIRVNLSERHIKGQVRCEYRLPFSRHIFEKNHAFIKIGDEYFRKNEIWRQHFDVQTGNLMQTELVAENFVKVKYIPDATGDCDCF
jgi:vancomycin resistance protein VanW